ncbi:MAG: S1 RNA-binding domain-containing protein [Polyangiaceae bacterium]|nr:S1 RNA-binding domain-containing protein [Polyangiaceae bacterium]
MSSEQNSNEPTETSTVPSVSVSELNPKSSPSVLAEAASAGEADASDDGDDGEDTTEEAAAGTGEAQGTGDGDQKKKRRRRRRKKKDGGEGAVEGGAQVSAEGGADASANGGANHSGAKKDGPRKDAKKKKKEHRERPAFNVGDVVFGKIQFIDEDAIIVDLSGKALGVFDKLELLLAEDHAEEIDRKAEKAELEADAIMAERDPNQPVEEASTVVAQDEAQLMALLAEKREEKRAARIIAPGEEAVEGEETAEGEEAVAAEGATPPAPVYDGTIQLPKIVLETGAPFVAVVHNDGGRGGNVVLTHHPKRASLAKPGLAKAFKEKTEVFGLVTGAIKGGVEADVDGVRAFVPASHMDLRLGADLGSFVGRRLSFHVTQYGKKGRDVVLSRKAMLEAESKVAREKIAELAKGDTVIEGVVRNVVTFGAFIDIGGIEGLVPLSEMSHNRSDTPADCFKVGETVSVKLLRVDEKGKIWLSRKATIPDPWGDTAKKYAVGTKHTGKVVRLQPFGAFLELEPGIDGLIHTLDLSLKRVEHANEVVKEGDTMEVVVASLDLGARKIALHPAPQGAQAEEAPQKVIVHKSVKAVVAGTDVGGLYVRITGVTGRNARGFVPASATGTPRGSELRKSFATGSVIEAKVLELDPRKGEVTLSIRALAQDSEKNAYQQYRQKVKQEAKFGTFGDLLAKRNVSPKE